jgi:4'-phosphopantetheinyl transferase EntD
VVALRSSVAGGAPGAVALATATAAELYHFRPFPEEHAISARFTSVRRFNFLLGRLAARRAISKLAAPQRPILQTGHAPRFPDGLVGSIAHSGELAVALVSHALTMRALGVDLEVSSLPTRAAAFVCSAEEARWVAAGCRPEHRVKSLFSAKEALYKALHPLTGEALRFTDVLLTPCSGGFDAVIGRDLGGGFAAGSRFFVGLAASGQAVLTWVLIRRPAPDLSPTLPTAP